MRKVVVSVVVVFLLFGSIVYAAANHGKFEGYNIVKMKSDGKELAVEDTPAINFKGRTMVPIYMLRQLCVEVTWNADEYSVDASINSPSTKELVEIYREIQSYRFFTVLTDQTDLLSYCINLVELSVYGQDYERSLKEVNRIDVTTLSLMLTGSERWEYKDHDDFITVVDAISKGKDALLKLDAETARTNWVIAKSTLNSIYHRLDNRMTSNLRILQKYVMDENFNFIE